MRLAGNAAVMVMAGLLLATGCTRGPGTATAAPTPGLIVREPRNGKDLRLALRPAAGGAATTVVEPAHSSPGEVYPSIVDVPAPGCWTLVSEWDTHRATLELSYQAG
jgi:hypothetical protein